MKRLRLAVWDNTAITKIVVYRNFAANLINVLNMKTKRFSLFILLLTVFTLSIGAQRTFNHPGSILSQTDLDRIKAHVEAGDEPWKSCWATLQADTYAKSSYTAKPSTEIGGSNGNR